MRTRPLPLNSWRRLVGSETQRVTWRTVCFSLPSQRTGPRRLRLTTFSDLNENEASAAELLAKVGGLGDAARDLAYRLFLIAESKNWAKEAGPYNALAASWLDISRLAAAEPDGPKANGFNTFQF